MRQFEFWQARRKALYALALTGTALATPALAQDARPEQPPEAREAEDATTTGDVVVTGSRLVRRDYVSASPISTFSAEDLADVGAVTVDKLLNTVPQFQPNFSATSNNPSNNGIITANLRGLGVSRTLVLIDGRRVTPSYGTQTANVVDLSQIPTGLIQSVEVITGGASAVYGSDAIAGVVNFKLNDRFEGLELSAQNGLTSYGDGFNTKLDASFGWRDKDGRGGFAAYAGYLRQDPILADTRPVTRDAVTVTRGTDGLLIFTRPTNQAVLDGTFVPSAANLPSQAAVNGVFASYGVPAGAVARTQFLNFNADGTLFNGGTATAPTVFNYRGSGQLTQPYNFDGNDGGYLTLDQRIVNLGLLADWKLGEAVTLYTRAAYSWTENTRQTSPAQTTSLTVPITNPFIPTALRTILASRPNPTATFQLARRLGELGFNQQTFTKDYYQLLGGVRAELGAGWTLDTYLTYGRVSQKSVQPGSFRLSLAQGLLNAADGGVAQCGGFNVFGPGLVSQGCANFIAYQPTNSLKADQFVAESTLTGDLFQLPAGPVSTAIGASYRRESINAESDAFQRAGDVAGFSLSATPTMGSTDVTEGFIEVGIPILRDVPGFHRLDVTLGYRYSDYRFSGGVSAYKGEVSYSPFEGITLRGSYDRAVRAPNINELFSPRTDANVSIGADPCSFNSTYRTNQVAGVDGTRVRALCLAQGISPILIDSFVGATSVLATTGGNTALTPEVADTFTAGLVFRAPSNSGALRGFSGSVDFYDIRVRNVISSGVVSAASFLPRCYNQAGGNPNYSADNEFCAFFGRDISGAIVNLRQVFSNTAAARNRGIDIQAEYSLNFAKSGRSAFIDHIAIRGLATVLLAAEQQVLSTDPFIDFVGTIGTGTASPYPRVRTTATFEFGGSNWELGSRWRYIGPMSNNSLITNPAALTSVGTPAYSYFDLYGSLKINSQLSFNAGVNNLLQKEPPIYSGAQPNTNTNATLFDIIGRQFFLRARVRF